MYLLNPRPTYQLKPGSILPQFSSFISTAPFHNWRTVFLTFLHILQGESKPLHCLQQQQKKTKQTNKQKNNNQKNQQKKQQKVLSTW